ncbi:hypothetical protein [Oceanithermus sp.]
MLRGIAWAGLVLALVLAGCTGTRRFAVGGQLTGLAAGRQLVLQNNGDDDLTLTEDGPFVFTTRLPDGSRYHVTVAHQPEGQTCFVARGEGVIQGANVRDVRVDCYVSGALDPTFGEQGIFVYDAGGDEEARDLAVAPGGRLLIVGARTPSGGRTRRTVWALTADGALDPQFGDAGIADDDPRTLSAGNALRLSDGGFVYIAGERDGRLAVWRLESSGEPEPSWGLRTWLGSSAQDPTGYDLLEDPQQRVLVIGKYEDVMNLIPTSVLLRFLPDGNLDSGFGTSGAVLEPGEGHALALDAQGRIVTAGSRLGKRALYRYDSSGQPDASFGTNGRVIATTASEGRALALGEDGSITVAGWLSNGNDLDLAVWRFGPDGSADTSFAGAGTFVYDAGGDERAYDLVLDGQGRLLVAGAATSAQGVDVLLLRLDPYGRPDPTFGTNGVVHIGSAGDELGYAVALDAADRILVAGFRSSNSGRDLAVWRVVP